MKRILREYFNYTKKQHLAIFIMMAIILIIVTINFYLPRWIHPPATPPVHDIEQLMAQIYLDSNSYAGYENHHEQPTKLTPFKFDPNTLDENGFRKLGLREKLIHTLLNYRNKGGRFYNPESLKRIYGLREDEFQQLLPFINIPPNQKAFPLKPTSTEFLLVDLNLCDTAQLIKLNGIGAHLALNIILYRSQLGGFVHIDQIKEVYGISEETFGKIKPHIQVKSQVLNKLNLNQATLAELNQHPYLKGKLARALVDYRRSKDYKIENIEQIKEIELINEEIFRKIVPYLRLQ